MESFEIVTNIGRGSSGAVFLAKHLKTKKLVAIKRIEIDENRRSRCKKSVVREATILRRLVHPYIVECEDWFLDNEEKLMHIVLEYCNGGTMQDMVRQAKTKNSHFPEEKVLKWMAQIVSAVAFMHSKKILHRDLKTENVFIVKPDTAKLGDFGISKEIDHTLDMAQTCVGTPCYLSPELCQDIPYSSKSDVWALGCLIFELAALKPAFDAANLVSLFYKIVKGDFADLPDHCSKEMLDIISMLLQKDPDDRPTAAKLLEHPSIAKYAEQIGTSTLPKNSHKSAVNRQDVLERKRPPKLSELRHKSGNVEEISSFENQDTFTNDETDRTISPGPSYAYNMFLSGIKAKSTLESKALPPISASCNRAASVLGMGDQKEVCPAVPKLFAYEAGMHARASTPPPQEVETARPQTCPHSASRIRTEPVKEEVFTDTVVTWSGYGDRGSRHRSGRRRCDSISLSSGSDESSDSEIETSRKTTHFNRKQRSEKRHNAPSLSSDEDGISEELIAGDMHDDDIPEDIEECGEECSGDSTHTGDEQGAGDSGRILPGSAWLRSKRTQVLQRNHNRTNHEKKNNGNIKKIRLPGSSWLSKEQRAKREKTNQESCCDDAIVLGGDDRPRDVTPERRKEGRHGQSGNIRNLPGSAWLRRSHSKSPQHAGDKMKSPVPHGKQDPITKQPSMVLESFSSSGNEYSSPDKRKSESDYEYSSDFSYADDFEDYEDDFEFSGDRTTLPAQSQSTNSVEDMNIVNIEPTQSLGEDMTRGQQEEEGVKELKKVLSGLERYYSFDKKEPAKKPDDDMQPPLQNKSSLDVVRQGCIDLLGKEVFEDLTNHFKRGLTFSQALCKFDTNEVDAEALEACYLILDDK